MEIIGQIKLGEYEDKPIDDFIGFQKILQNLALFSLRKRELHSSTVHRISNETIDLPTTTFFKILELLQH